MKFKKLLALCITAAMFLTAGSGAFAATASGSDEAAPAVKKVSASQSTAEPRTYAAEGGCGDSMTWSYNETTYVLTISGSGAMTSHPWKEYKEKISRIVFSGNITSICNEAFIDCTNIDSVSIPDSVTSIGYSAFKGCKNLDEVVFGANSSLTTFGTYYSNSNHGVFQNCINLYEITLPKKLTGIPLYTFAGCTNLDTVNIGNNVTFIGDNAFQSCDNLENITVPNSVESLGKQTFYNCVRLESIRLGSGLKTIGYEAFAGCSSLKSVAFPASVTEIGYSAFKNLKNLSSVTFASNSNLTTLKTYYSNSNYGVFQNCTAIKTITLPDKLTGIPLYTFAGCTNLETVKIGSGVTFIGNDAFKSCVNLKSIVIPNNVTSLGAQAFYDCSKLGSVKFGSALETIGREAFINCTCLTSISIPASVTEIGYSAFKNLGNITSVTFAENSNLTTFGTYYSNSNYGVFQNCTGIKSVVLPDKLTAVPLYTFYGCSNLESVTVGKHVTSIGKYAFGNCSTLNNVVLPKALTSISENAFAGCSSIKTVRFTGSESRWNNLKEDGINSTGNTYLLNAPKFVYNYTGTPVSITSHPADVTVHAGDNATFKVGATGTGLKYQWYYKKNGAASWSAWNGRTTASTTATANESWNKMQVRCKVTDGAGNAVYSNAATITVAAELKITQQPANVTVASGSNATFKVTATGTGLKYQWYYKKSGATSWSAWGSRTTASTTATANDTWNGMQVRCKVTDAAGKSIYSNAATVTIGSATVSITSHPANVTVHSGDNAAFKVTATGTGLKYQWYYKKNGATAWSAWNGHTTASTTATANDSWNKMQVRCKVTNSAGKYVYSNAATITIAAPLQITQQPKNITASEGEDVAFIIKASGSGLKYQWYIKKAGQTSWKAWNGRTASSFFATSNSTWDGMQVRCIVTDAAGAKVTSNTIKITLL